MKNVLIMSVILIKRAQIVPILREVIQVPGGGGQHTEV